MLKITRNVRRWVRRAERGNGEADFAFVLTTPLLAGIMLTGLFFALVGFWRVGASWSNQLGTQAGAVGGNATGITSGLFAGWAGNGPGNFASYGENSNLRIATGKAAATKSMGAFFVFGKWGDFDLKATNTTRLERFYPGKKSCSGGECSE